VGPNFATIDHPLAVYQPQRLLHSDSSRRFSTLLLKLCDVCDLDPLEVPVLSIECSKSAAGKSENCVNLLETLAGEVAERFKA